MARTKPKLDNRNVNIIGLSVDLVEAADIKDTQGMAPNCPTSQPRSLLVDCQIEHSGP